MPSAGYLGDLTLDQLEAVQRIARKNGWGHVGYDVNDELQRRSTQRDLDRIQR